MEHLIAVQCNCSLFCSPTGSVQHTCCHRRHHHLLVSRARSNFWLLPNESLLCLRPDFVSQKSLMASQCLFIRVRGWFRLVVAPTTIFSLLCGLKGKQFWIGIASLGANFLTLCSPYTCKVSKKKKKKQPFNFEENLQSVHRRGHELLSSAFWLYKYDIFQAAVTFKSQTLDLLAKPVFITFFFCNSFFFLHCVEESHS